jgi:hypothetical protein
MRGGAAACLLFMLLANALMVSGNGGADGAGSGAHGRGTSRATTLIYNVYDLQNMSLDPHGAYELANDIDASATSSWNNGTGFVPVGTSSTAFNGSLDGKNHTIRGLYINRPAADNVGLFGYIVRGGSVKNLGLVGIDVTGKKTVGGLVGYNYNGTVDNSHSTGKVAGTGDNIGGLVGYESVGLVNNSYAATDVAGKIEPYNYTGSFGGLVGLVKSGAVNNSYATGNVTGRSLVGGLVGQVDGGAVNNSYATGNVSGMGWDIGGLLGYVGSGTLNNSYFTGSVNGGDYCIGGLVGNYVAVVSSVRNSHYNIDKVSINRKNLVTLGGLFNAQYRDWISNNLTLKISNYSPTLVPSGGYYSISNVQGVKDLLGFADIAGYGFRLAADIDLSPAQGLFIPYHAAKFDGGNHVISNLDIDLSFVTYVGMFGYNDGGTISHIRLDGTIVNGYRFVGGLVGYNYHGTVDNSNVAGDVNGRSSNIGGLLGYNNGGSVNNSYAAVNVSGINEFVGGLVGYSDGGTVSNSHATGNVTASAWFIGGLVGQFHNGFVNNSYATGNVKGTTYIGGLTGGNWGTVNGSYATGNVNGSSLVGGLSGKDFGGTVNNSHATGNVIGDSEVGGLMGESTGTVNNSYASGAVTGEYAVGGLVGSSIDSGGTMGTIRNSHYNIDKMSINGGHHVTAGGLFEAQYRDWFSSNLSLDIADYSTSLVLNGEYFDICDVQGLSDLLGFSDVAGYRFRLAADIDLSKAPGLYIPHIAAEFEGGNHTISNLDINMTFAMALGMFGLNDGGTISNIVIVGNNVVGNTFVSGLVGYNFRGTVNNSHATGNVNGTEEYVGGIVGYNYDGTVKNSYTTGNVTAHSQFVGGLVGYNDRGTVNNSYSTANVDGTPNVDSVGGLVGYNGGTVSNSYAAGNVNGTGNSVGGLVGYNSYGTVNNSFATANVTGTRDNIGGLVGYNMHGTVYASYAEGNVNGRGSNVGGLEGYDYYGTVSNSYATGNVTGSLDDVGGLVGTTRSSSLSNSYSAGSVAGTDANTGGLVGDNNGTTVSSCFWDMQTSGLASSHGGTGKTTAEMKTRSTFTNAGWDFERVWFMEENVTYPLLRALDENPRANAGPDKTVEMGTLVIFDASGSFGYCGIINYTWMLMDGVPVTLYGVRQTYRFDNPGMFVVTLKVTDVLGNWDDDTMTVTVNDITPPVSNAGPDRTVDEGTLVTFNGSGSSDNVGIVNYTWTFTDGSAVTLYGAQPTYRFDNPGIFVVTLNITDAAGNSATGTLTITVRDLGAPVADAGLDEIVDEGTLMTFDGSGSSDNVGIKNYSWTFTDGIPITLLGVQPTFNFENPGIFVVTLNITDAAGNWGIDTMTVTVNVLPPPVANAGPDQLIDEGTLLTFNGGRSFGIAGIVNYTWNFSDGILVTLYDAQPTYRFENPGIFIVTLNVTDVAGNWKTDTLIVKVKDITSPVANAGPDQTVDEKISVMFNGNGSSDNVEIINYTWTFEYGAKRIVLSGVSPLFFFGVPGVYSIKLNVTDAVGFWTEDTMVVTVRDITPPVANAGHDLKVPAGKNIFFNGSLSTDNVAISKFFWNFTYGEKARSLEGITVFFKFDKPGVYEVVLTVIDAAGNRGEDRVVVTVEPSVNVDFGSLAGLLWMPVLLMIMAVGAGYYMFMKRKNASPGEPERSKIPQGPGPSQEKEEE